MADFWGGIWAGLRADCFSVWSDIPVDRFYRTTDLMQIAFSELTRPYAIIEIPPTKKTEDYGGAIYRRYQPTITFFRIEDLQEGIDTAADLETQLFNLETFWSVHSARPYGQILDNDMLDVSQTNRINQHFLTKNLQMLGGVLMVEFLLLRE